MQTPANLIFWILFVAFIVLMLALDLGVFNRKARAVSLSSSLRWTALWMGLAAGFAGLLYFYGHLMTGAPAEANQRLSLEFITGYIVEVALSVDNLFLFLLIFRYFRVPPELQRKVLLWGVIGAIAMRAIFIAAGVTLLNRFHWITYLFGAFLIYAGLKLLLKKSSRNPADSFITRFARQHLRINGGFSDGNFTVRKDGVLYFTTLALVLLVVEATDVIFATDSIPAVLAVTRQPYVVFTSNVFAILGLRSLYFALAGLMEMFHLLHYGLAAVLMFIGAKMLAADYFEIPVVYALGVIVAALSGSILLSLVCAPAASGSAKE
jgi:tellurite resistance protein TerC